MKASVKDRKSVYAVISVILAYIVTIIMLLVISLLMLKAGIGSELISVLLVLTYIIPPFIGGFFMGKHVNSRRFIWGGIVAVMFFCIYLILVGVMGTNEETGFLTYAVRALIILASGVAGGMLS